MSAIAHHTPDAMLAAYASGSLGHAFSVVVASHVSLCLDCRAALEAHQGLGGALLEEEAPEHLSPGLRDRILSNLDAAQDDPPAPAREGIFPGPVVQALAGRAPRWKKLGMGVRQDILHSGPDGSVRLLHIPPGQAVPDHSHGGLELTLVLQGSFSDETGHYGVGDLEVADESLEHTPVAGPGADCICLAATDAPLRFRAVLPRLLQPLFRI